MMLAGKVFVVTGATGGLGGAVAAALLEAGASVAVTGQRPAVLADVIAGLDADGQATNLADEEQVTRYMAWAADRFGGLDGLAAIAGGFAGGTPVHETSLATWQGQLEMNLTTAFLSCKAVVPHLLRRGGGAIVMVGSRPALRGAPSIAAYSVAKSGILRLAEAMAEELKAHDVTVNCVLPSVIEHPGSRASGSAASHPRGVTPAALAAVVRWLLGPEARDISGAAIPVYGKA
jgi:NAD(P)-dependent dehydrogenase (short-subunit alcohol dehydrogenase family)